jgi:methionyl-tRNA formyltransferase
MRTRIAYFGLPLGALLLRRAGHALVSVCLGHPDAVGNWRLRRSLRTGAPLLGKPSLEEPRIVSTIASARPDAILSWFWPKRIPERVLGLAPRGAFGVHPSLLPRHRGGDPYFHAILTGDRETGVTLHRLEAEYDTGAIVDARALAIREGENAWQLARRLDRPSLALLLACAARLDAGEALLGTPQDERLATPAEPPSEELLAIDWENESAWIARLVRAAAPQPGATAMLGDALVSVLAVTAVSDAPRVLEPGEAYFARGLVHVRTGDGALRIDRVRIEELDEQNEEAGDLFTVGQELHGEAIARLVPTV